MQSFFKIPNENWLDKVFQKGEHLSGRCQQQNKISELPHFKCMILDNLKQNLAFFLVFAIMLPENVANMPEAFDIVKAFSIQKNLETMRHI